MPPSLPLQYAAFAKNKARFEARLRRARRQYERGDTRLDYPPFTLFIESVFGCNIKCVTCPLTFKSDQAVRLMDMGLYRRIVEEAAPHIFELWLFLEGEPLLNKNIFEMVRFAKEKGVPLVHLTSNGTVMTEKIAAALIESGLDRISFSFELDSPERYESLREGAKYDRTLANIRLFLDARRRADERSVVALRRGAALRPYTAIRFLAFDGENVSPGEWIDRLFPENPPDEAGADRIHKWGGGFGEKVDYVSPLKGEAYTPCDHVYRYLVVRADGTVPGCCRDFGNDYVVGDAKGAGVMDLWNSEPMRALRGKLNRREHESVTLCRDCDRLWRLPGEGMFD